MTYQEALEAYRADQPIEIDGRKAYQLHKPDPESDFNYATFADDPDHMVQFHIPSAAPAKGGR